MSQLQSQAKACIDGADDILTSTFSVSSNDANGALNSTYQQFLQYAWCGLPTSGADGAALATVSCMPVWELLNQSTSPCAPTSNEASAVAVQLLTTMYPKSKDRRCLFQQLNSFGNSSQSAVPLSTRAPLQALVVRVSAVEASFEYVRLAKRSLRMAAVGAYTDGKDGPAVASAVRTFVTSTLPKCTLVAGDKEVSKQPRGELYIAWRSDACDWHAGSVFLLTLWSLFMVAEFLGLPEAKELAQFVRSSRWASRTLNLEGRETAYSKLLAPFLDVCALCVSLNPRSPSAAVDTVPLIDPRVMPFLMGTVPESCPTAVATRFGDSYSVKVATKTKESLTVRRANNVTEQLCDSVPGEIEFMGTSSSCRDFDQLAYLCRNCLFAPTVGSKGHAGVAVSWRRDMLFNRKRPRGGAKVEGPCFLPVQSAVSDMLERTEAEEQTTLERLCCKWRAEGA